MKLSLALGWPSVGLMLSNISNKELNDWIAYYQIEPFPEEREDLRNGSLMSLIANVNRPKGKAPYYPKSFIPDFWGSDGTPKPKQTQAETYAMAEMINASFGGKIVKRVQ